jgi:iron complex outermembrane receptor protein
MTNADERTYDAWVLGRVRTGGASIDTFANVTTREQGVPTLALVPSREARATFDRGIGGVRSILPLGAATSLEAQTSVSYAHAVYQDPLEELALGAPRVDLSGGRLAERLAIRTMPIPSLTVHAALDLASETLSREDDGIQVLHAQRIESRLSSAARLWVGESFSVQPLVALECEGTSATTTTACGHSLEATGRLGLSWTRPTWDVFANVGRYERTPALGELYGISVFVRGNPMLLPESGITVDGGLRWKTSGKAGSLWAFAEAFVRFSDDLIAFVRSSEGFTVPINIDAARVAGVETAVGSTFLRWFSLSTSATVLDPRDTTSNRLVVNTILPFESRLVLVPRLSFETHAGPRSHRIHAELRWVYQSSRYADAAGLAVIPDQSSLDAELVAATKDGHWTVRARLADLLNTERYDIVGFPLPRRAAYLALETRW